MTNHYVEIVEMDDDGKERVEKRMGPMGERKAEKVERGVSINLNHERYFTRVVTQED